MNGALYIPPGIYRLTKVIETRKSIVLRGAGKDATILYFPFSLTEVMGNTWNEQGNGENVSDWAHSTGFINFWGWDPIARDRTFLTNVTAPAKRGDTLVQVGFYAFGRVCGPGISSMFLRSNGAAPGAVMDGIEIWSMINGADVPRLGAVLALKKGLNWSSRSCCLEPLGACMGKLLTADASDEFRVDPA